MKSLPPKRLIGIWSILLATSSTKTAQTASSFHDRGASVKDAMVCPSVRGTRGLAEQGGILGTHLSCMFFFNDPSPIPHKHPSSPAAYHARCCTMHKKLNDDKQVRSKSHHRRNSGLSRPEHKGSWALLEDTNTDVHTFPDRRAPCLGTACLPCSLEIKATPKISNASCSCHL